MSALHPAYPVDAATLAAMVADRLGTIPGPLRDGCYSVDASSTVDATGMWRLHVGDDAGPDAPYGISWAIDSPVERGVESGGWEMLPAADLDREATSLAEMLRRNAEVQA